MKTTDFNITINENADKINFADFGNGSTDEWIKRAEKRLGVKFPNTYTYWLKNYFGGEINGDEIYSVYEMDFDTLVGGDIVYMNELNRKDGFISKDELLIQTNDQAMMYYFDLKQMDEEGEAPVYVKFGDIMEKYADDFFELPNGTPLPEINISNSVEFLVNDVAAEGYNIYNKILKF